MCLINWNEKKQFQFEALRDGERFWKSVSEDAQCPSTYGRIGRIIPLLNERGEDLATARAFNAKELWQGFFKWNITKRPPYLAHNAAPFNVIYGKFIRTNFSALCV